MKETQDRQLISFNWAIKRLLRGKANFVVIRRFLVGTFDSIYGLKYRIEDPCHNALAVCTRNAAFAVKFDLCLS